MTMPMPDDTICAISTPPGTGGIAVARISGSKALETAQRIWKGKRPITEAAANTCLVGSVTDTCGEELDQAVATVFRAPRSFTGEDVVELSVHGSKWVQQELIMALIGAGARIAEPGEFSRRAFASGRMDLAQTEAVADIIASGSRAAQRVALRQMRGDFSKRIEDMRGQLLELAALLELELDFSEEDVEFASRKKLIELAVAVRTATARLAAGFSAGTAIRDGVPVAIVGATNAGKSSLLNALSLDDRAIVSDVHGTTRDVVEDVISIGDYTFRLKDTAGFRHTSDVVESLGIERSLRELREAAIVLLVTDSADMERTPWDDVKRAMEENPEATLIIAANKCDIATVPAFGDTRASAVIATSARTGEGIDELRNAICDAAARLFANGACGDTLVTNARHYKALKDASEAAGRTIDALELNLPGDLVAQDLRECISHLGAITGAISTPDILQTIFSRFCIGK